MFSPVVILINETQISRVAIFIILFGQDVRMVIWLLGKATENMGNIIIIKPTFIIDDINLT